MYERVQVRVTRPSQGLVFHISEMLKQARREGRHKTEHSKILDNKERGGGHI